uniref:Variant surface glycoprotein n=1 Tax=Trypanosoma brucei TaxID=5691 RepID=A0A1V0FY62_9TRYP|nr:variant surface glycoprotein [Trypanosoma brucei]
MLTASAFAFFFLWLSGKEVEPATGDQAGDLQALCEAWRAAESLMTTKYNSPDLPNDLQELLNLNMSLSQPDWQQIFTDDSAENTWERFEQKHAKALNGGDWQQLWPHLIAARKANKADNTPWNTKHAKLVKQARGARVQPYIKELADEALGIFLATQTKDGNINPESDDGAVNQAKRALCGWSLPYQGGNIHCKDTAGTPTKANICDSGNQGRAGDNIATDIVCLCQTATNQVCVNDAEFGTTVMTGATLENGALAKYLQACPKETPFDDPKAKVRAAVGRLGERLGHGKARDTNGKVRLGKKYTTDCTNQASACVDYSQYFSGGKKGIPDIPWAAKLIAAAKQ